MWQLSGTNSIEHILKGATLTLANGSDRLNVTVKIPYGALDNKRIDTDEFSDSGYLFHLNLNINPAEIQEVLTSAKVFLTQGLLTLNGITRPVKVSYVPIVSGTEENGEFNLYMNIQFSLADFKLEASGTDAHVVLTISDAKVNRV